MRLKAKFFPKETKAGKRNPSIDWSPYGKQKIIFQLLGTIKILTNQAERQILAQTKRNGIIEICSIFAYTDVDGNLLMRRLVTILSLIMTTYSFGQINHMHDGENETIYEKAIQELIRNFKDDGPIYIRDDSRISNFFWDRQADGRKIIFLSDVNEADELKKNENLIRVYEIEYPMINGDQLQIKINHMVIFEIDILKNENEWPKKLTDKERELARKGIAKGRLIEGGSEAKNYSSLINNAWTYITFLFDSQDKEFKIKKVETKTI